MEDTNIDAGAPLPEEAQNRTFMILLIAGIVVLVLGIACMIGGGIWLSQQRKAQNSIMLATAHAIETQNALNLQAPTDTPQPEASPTPDAQKTSQAVLETAMALAETSTPVVPPSLTPTPEAEEPAEEPTETPEPTATETPPTEPQAGGGPTITPSPLVEGLGGGAETTPTAIPTATGLPGTRATPTVTPTTIAVMPGTGFADEVGLPTLIILSLALVAVVFVARRLRASLR